MKLKALLPLGLCLVLAAGCATQKTRTGRNNNYAAGLVSVNTGHFGPVTPNTINVNTNEIVGNMANPSGTQVKLFWGLITFHDY